MWNVKKYNKLENIAKKKEEEEADSQNKLVVTHGERGSMGIVEKEVQIFRYKIRSKEILYTMGDITNILY